MSANQNQLKNLMPDFRDRAIRFYRLLLYFVLVLMVIQGLFNYLIDPYDYYKSPVRPETGGEYRREDKVELLRNAGWRPEALILGSSRVRAIDPAYAGYVFGLRFFHSGVARGSVQDWLSYTKYAVDELGYPIKMIIIGVDPGSFAKSTIYLHHPVYTPELRRHLRYPLLSVTRSLVNIWSPYQTKDSWYALKSALNIGDEEGWKGDRTWMTDVNGNRIKPYRDDGFLLMRPMGRPDIIIDDEVKRNMRNTQINKMHVSDFHALLDFAESKGIKVLAFITPISGYLRSILEKTHYPQTRRKTRDILEKASEESALFCDIDFLREDLNDFIDPHHFELNSGRLIIDALHECMSEKEGV